MQRLTSRVKLFVDPVNAYDPNVLEDLPEPTWMKDDQT